MATNSDDPVVTVFKVGVAKQMDDLVRNGHVFMNTAAFFANLEEADARNDPNEGTSYCRQATGATLSVETSGTFEPIATLTGPIIHTSDELRTANLYCLHVRRRSSYGEEFSLDSLRFGDTAVIFLDFIEFLRRVTDAAHRAGHRVSYQVVEYVDRETYTGPMGLFRKFSKYASESEHRIAIVPGMSPALSLHVGALNDITLTVSAHDRLKLVPKTPST